MSDTSTDRQSTFARIFGQRGLWLLTILVTATCVGLIGYVDRPLALFIRHQTDPDVLAVFLEITEFGKADFYILGTVLAFVLGRALFLWTNPRPASLYYYAIARVSLFIMASMATSAVFVHALKITVGRARPKELLLHDYYGFDFFAFDPGLNSFPSGHSQTAWAAMIPLAIAVPKLRVVLIAFAVLIAVSRIMISAHFLSDVLMGSHIGLMAAFFIHQIWFSDVGPLRLPPKTDITSNKTRTSAS